MMSLRRSAFLGAALLLVACSNGSRTDTGTPSSDAGTPDSGIAARSDAGSGGRDAGADAGSQAHDAGLQESDAGQSQSPDAGQSEQPDAGHSGPPDAGQSVVSVDWCDVQWPHQIPDQANNVPLPRAGQVFGNIYAQVYSNGVTNVPGNQGSFLADIGYGPPGSQPGGSSAWTWIPATFNPSCTTCNGNNYEYVITLTAPADGSYNYSARFSGDGGRIYQYCAGPGTQRGTPYNPHAAYMMWVAGQGCQADETVCGTGGDCCSGTCSNIICQPGPPTCSNGQMLCGSSCVDTTSDPNNCGKCGNVCSSGICNSGSCGCIPRTSSRSCSSGINCCTGLCDPTSSVCQCSPPGGYCSSDTDCCPDSGAVCRNGICGHIAPGGSCPVSGSGSGCEPPFLCMNGSCRDSCLPSGQPYGSTNPSFCCSGTGSNGVCTGCAAAGGSCETDADCCNGAGPCIGGSCAAGCIAEGSALPGNQQQCTDVTAQECCSGTCSNGSYPSCTAPACHANNWRFACECSPDGYPCSHDVDCCGGTCNGSTCQGGATCQATGVFCTQSSQCCSQNCANGVCMPGNWNPGSACLTDRDCATGVCSGGGCVCQQSGALCRNNADCCNNSCSGYTYVNNEMVGQCAGATCRANGLSCSGGSQCCSRNCQNGSCAP